MSGRIRHGGPDPNFPVLHEYQRFDFPWKIKNDPSVVDVGGNLSPGMLLSAYEQGLFPWYNEDDPILWHSPDPRFVLFRNNLHISKSMKKIFRQKKFEIRFDTDFEGVIRNCAGAERKEQDGTWITDDMTAAYTKMHHLGWAHSAESFIDGKLAGGCYGIRLGNAFFGESMFSITPNASKAAFLTLAQILFDDELAFIDSQVHTDHLESLGAVNIPRTEYLTLLYSTLQQRHIPADKVHPQFRRLVMDQADRRGKWSEIYENELKKINSY